MSPKLKPYMPDGLAFDLFAHTPRSMPFPDWTPWVIELTYCKRIYRIECDEVQKVGEQRKCRLVEREFCLGWRNLSESVASWARRVIDEGTIRCALASLTGDRVAEDSLMARWWP